MRNPPTRKRSRTRTSTSPGRSRRATRSDPRSWAVAPPRGSARLAMVPPVASTLTSDRGAFLSSGWWGPGSPAADQGELELVLDEVGLRPAHRGAIREVVDLVEADVERRIRHVRPPPHRGIEHGPDPGHRLDGEKTQGLQELEHRAGDVGGGGAAGENLGVDQ